ncbi:hypothetical protein BJL90_15175 [Clostridium formicaceticum]|uniref:Uncharacterized protein n=1 Tax=Clostridium formicaceticum TaxID=1497 RepID=A0ABN4T9B4_9CLOT|nr:hypothetical protein BJL90_15175 [Clostridium formicaceticum]
MKFLVSASDAQSGVVSESKEMGAIRKGMRAMTLAPWRPLEVFMTSMVETYQFVRRVRRIA